MKRKPEVQQAKERMMKGLKGLEDIAIRVTEHKQNVERILRNLEKSGPVSMEQKKANLARETEALSKAAQELEQGCVNLKGTLTNPVLPAKEKFKVERKLNDLFKLSKDINDLLDRSSRSAVHSEDEWGDFMSAEDFLLPREEDTGVTPMSKGTAGSSLEEEVTTENLNTIFEEKTEDPLNIAIAQAIEDISEASKDEAISKDDRKALESFCTTLDGIKKEYQRDSDQKKCYQGINQAIKDLKNNAFVEKSGPVWGIVRPILNTLIRAVNAAMNGLGFKSYSMDFYKKSLHELFANSKPAQALTQEGMIKAAIEDVERIMREKGLPAVSWGGLILGGINILKGICKGKSPQEGVNVIKEQFKKMDDYLKPETETKSEALDRLEAYLNSLSSTNTPTSGS